MSYVHRFAKQSSHYVVGRACLIAIGLVSYPLFTRLLPVDQYGLMGLVATVILCVTTFSKLGMQHALQRFHKERLASDGTLRPYFSTLFHGALGGAIAITAMYAGLLYVLPSTILERSVRNLLLAASLLIVVRTVQSMVTNWLLIDGRTVLLNTLEIISKASLALVVTFLFLRWQRTAFAFVIGSAIVEIGILLGTLHYIARRDLLSFGEFDQSAWKEGLQFAFPMIAAEIGAVLLAFGDRFLVGALLGATSLGYYTAAYGLAQYTWELMTTPISAVFFPIFMTSWAEKGAEEARRLLSSSLRLFLAPAFALLAMVVLCSKDAIVILASAKYRSAHVLLPVLVAGMIAGALPVFFRSGLLIMKKPTWVAGITLAGLGVNLAVNLVLLPKIGILGAAIATFISYFVQALLTARMSQRVFPFPVPYAAGVLYLLCAIGTIALGVLVSSPHPMTELCLRMAVCLVYPTLLLTLDSRLRAAVCALLNSRLQSRQQTATAD